jgi:hypothetical protein
VAKRNRTLVVVAPLALAIGAVACGSGPAAVNAKAASAAPAGLCQTLEGVLSDGPDPDADPVGYAQSQVLPLQGIHSSDTAAAGSLRQLIGGDEALVQSDGTDHAATVTIKKAFAAINRACPGVAP